MKWFIGAAITLLLFTLIAKAEGVPAGRLGKVVLDGTNSISFTVEDGVLKDPYDATSFKRTSTRKCVIDFKALRMTCGKKSYPFFAAEADAVRNGLNSTLFRYIAESMGWFDAGGKLERPPQPTETITAGGSN